jgi:hypothetical protein|tara:strand:- start:127 stop:405 length:279 start_codon:yes stop_codon:yes gene_type:complete
MPANKKAAAGAAAKKGALGTVKKIAKKVLPKIAKGAARATGALGVASTLYGFYKSGQKKSKGKVRKNQKPFLKNAKRKTSSVTKGRVKKKYI